MKIVRIVLVMLLVLSVNTQFSFARSGSLTQYHKPLTANEGRKLMSLKKAMLHDVHLAEPVKYFDIKQYDRDGQYVTGWSFDMATYKKLSNKEKKRIHSAKVKKPGGSFWKLFMNDGAYAGFYNLHYLDKNAKVHTISSRKKLLSFLGAIDTAAELSMLFLTHTTGKIRYKKIGKLYNIRINDVSYSDCDGCGEPACTLFVRQIVLDSRGKIRLDRQISERSFKSEKKCRRF